MAQTEMKIDTSKVPKEDMARALELLAKDKERRRKISEGLIKGSSWKDMTPEQKEKAKLAEQKRQAQIKLMVQKATEKGITVTDSEIDDYLRKKGKIK